MDKEILSKIASTVRQLAIDATQKANSGHPGLPMGCAELGALLWGEVMHYHPKDIRWPGRDRFVLSAGHGCLLQYSMLHLAGYDLSIEEIQNFRQLHSKTPGHPEYGHTPGIEVTTGPLGQGVASGSGLALAHKLLAHKFNTDEHKIFDNKVFVLCGDGCMMEGVQSEAASLAGHLGLDNLILLYDSNNICLDGPLSESMSEDVKMRYRAYGWDVFDVDGYNFDTMKEIFDKLRVNQKRPAMIEVHTLIGKGSPNRAGTHKAHGSPLGEEEAHLAKEALHLSEEPFFVPPAVVEFFERKKKEQSERYREWNEKFEAWSKANPELRVEWDTMHEKRLPDDLEEQLANVEIKSPIAGRSASQACLNKLGELLPQLIGGSADLSGSDMTMMKEFPVVVPGVFTGRNIKFGVREFAMGAMANGLSRAEFFTPYVGTFFVFSDYMRNAVRLASIGKHKVIYQFTHDSIFLGEDGPTHQAVEHLMSLRAMPNLWVIRPGDANEVKMAWMAALNHQGPTALVLSRQKIPEVPGTERPYSEGVGRGAYILRGGEGKPDYTLFATGSELALANDVATELEKRGKAVRLISMPCWELFEEQPKEYRASVVCGDLGKRVSIEAGSDLGWYKYIGHDGVAISVNTFGASAPAADLAVEYGFTVDAVLEQILS